jgi:cytoskeletal protein RodZ
MGDTPDEAEPSADRVAHSPLVGFMSVPVHRRLPIRRSTLLMAVAFVGFGTLLYFNPPDSTPTSTGQVVHTSSGDFLVPGAIRLPTTTTTTTATTTSAPAITTPPATTAPPATTGPAGEATTTRPVVAPTTTTTTAPATTASTAATTTTTPPARTGGGVGTSTTGAP